jgi:phosphate transport system substrate-binding protein
VQKRAILLLTAALVAAGCKFTEEKGGDKSAGAKNGSSSAPAQARTTVRVKGSDAMKPLASEIAEAYQKIRHETAVTVDGGGTAAGFTALGDGSTDIAAASRPISAEERAAVEGKRGHVVENPVGYDVVAVYVNAANPVKELSLKQLAGILSGATTNWKAVGGPNAPITLVGQAGSAGVSSYLGIPNPPKPVRDFADARGTIAAVAGDPNALGYAALVTTQQARLLWIAREDGGVSIAPSDKSVNDRSYPLSGRLYFYTLGNAANPEVSRFVAWARSPSAKHVFEHAGYVQ